ncbi:MAG TPA: ankyrin repeat domain-containing protein, partial [Blastocatellia bacterium]|nr:ankyrin repeat domain-containing protein [Blastocatellia bacterium]
MSSTMNRGALHYAASRGDVKEVARLLGEKGTDVNERDYDKRTPLHVAAA